MDKILQSLPKLPEIDFQAWLSAAILIVAGFVFARLARAFFTRSVGKMLSSQQQLLGAKILYYGLLVITMISALQIGRAHV